MEIQGDMAICGGTTSDEDPLLRRFILISKIIKITMIMIITATSENKTIPHACSYQARPLLVFVFCPLSFGVEESDGGSSISFEDNDVEARGLPVGSEILK